MSLEERNFFSNIPAEKRDYFEALYYRAEALPTLPTSEKRAITVDAVNIDCVLLRALEKSYYSMKYSAFERYLERLKNLLNEEAPQYFVYFPGANLYIKNADTNQYIAQFRIVKRTNEEEFFGA